MLFYTAFDFKYLQQFWISANQTKKLFVFDGFYFLLNPFKRNK